MKIAFIGQKGIPAYFGGIEFHVDELSRRLVARGHHVSTYVRSWYTPNDLDAYEGVRLLHTPTIHTKHLDAALHSFTSSLHTLTQDYDVVHYHALGPSFFAWIPKLRRQRLVVTIHALDWERPKWGAFARAFLKMAERFAIHLPHSTIVVSRSLQEYFEGKHGRSVHYIPNGVTVLPLSSPRVITQDYRLQGNDYILYLGRLVPEKRVDWLIKAFRRTSNQVRLVIAGNDDDAQGYAQHLQELAGDDRRLLFTGNVAGETKEELLSNALVYVTPSSVEGLPIALLEAMAHGRCCLVSNIPAHLEIIEPGQNGLLFECNDFEQFVSSLEALLARNELYRDTFGDKARRKVCEEYSWEGVVEATESLYGSVLDHSQSVR
jgi:glycosyltransferase involved in cell wall biosynthesis